MTFRTLHKIPPLSYANRIAACFLFFSFVLIKGYLANCPIKTPANGHFLEQACVFRHFGIKKRAATPKRSYPLVDSLNSVLQTFAQLVGFLRIFAPLSHSR